MSTRRVTSIICAIIGGTCIGISPLWFSVKIVTCFTLGYLIEWMFEYIDDQRP
jgi:hypothetical protein